jgi:hypothetical protein
MAEIPVVTEVCSGRACVAIASAEWEDWRICNYPPGVPMCIACKERIWDAVTNSGTKYDPLETEDRSICLVGLVRRFSYVHRELEILGFLSWPVQAWSSQPDWVPTGDSSEQHDVPVQRVLCSDVGSSQGYS